MSVVEPTPASAGRELDSRWEFDAPRFYDFEEGSPDGSPDKWFDTSATKGLASPIAPKPAGNKKLQGEAGTNAPFVAKQHASEEEAKLVRKALAHITNTTAANVTNNQSSKLGQPIVHCSGPKPLQKLSKSKRPQQQVNSEQARETSGVEMSQAKFVSPPESTAAEPLDAATETVVSDPKRRRTHSMATRSMTPGKAPKTNSDDTIGSDRPANSQGNVLTVPKSPNLVTKKRLRPTRFKPREVVEEEEMAAMPKFKARPLRKHILLDKSGRLGVPSVQTRPPTEPEPFHLATDARGNEYPSSKADKHGPFIFTAHAAGGNQRVTRSRWRAGGITEPEPFCLQTDLRGEARQAQQAAAAAAAAENKANVQMQQNRKGKRRRTSGAPTLATDARGGLTQAQLEAQRQLQVERARQQAEFKARPLNKAVLANPWQPVPSQAPLTIPDNVALASDARARERMLFDHSVALKQHLDEEERAAAEEQRRKEEEVEVRRYRKGLEFKAHPLPEFYGRHEELS